MSKYTFTREQVHQEMVDYFIANDIGISIRGKGTKVPTSIDDLSPRRKNPSHKDSITGKRIPNKEYDSARNRLHTRARKAPKEFTRTPPKGMLWSTGKVAPKPHRVEKATNNSITITLPSGMSATDLIDLIAIIRKSGAKCSL